MMKGKSLKKVPFKKRLTKSVVGNILMTIGILLVTIVSISTGTYIWQKYDISVGSISSERFVANVEVVNQIATDLKIKEAKESIKPLYKQDPDIGIQAIEEIQSFFNSIKTAKQSKEEELKKESMKNSDINNIDETESSIVIDNSNFLESTQTTSNYQTPIFLSNEKFNLLISLEDAQLDSLEKDILNIVANIMETGIRQDQLTNRIIDTKDKITELKLDSVLGDIAYSLASSVIHPNLIIDEEATQSAIDAKVAEVVPIVIKKGEKIVDKDEIITNEIYAILESLGYTQKDEWEPKDIIPIIGLIMITILIQAFAYEYIRTHNKRLWNGTKDKTMLFTMYCIIVLLIRIMTGIGMEYYMLIPIALLGMLVSMLIDLPLAILLNIIVSIVGTLIYNGGVDFLMYFIISGTFSCILTKYTYERNNTIKAASLISIINGVVILGIGFLFQKAYSDQLLFKSLLAMISGFIALIVMTGSLPFWEAAFDAITPIKLLELTNPNQAILKRLIIEAPGTYHHSIIVANLAEMAAMDIGANEALARAGAYYHDIGKLKYPNYFSENQVGENPHDYLLPLDSAKIIIGHVRDGYIYATDEKLPKVVKDMLIQHHGNTLVKYFYYKAKKDFPGETIKEEEYRYPGITPQFKEAAILMLADTVEAAVRSMFTQGKTIDEIKVIISNLIKDKLDDGQLIDSDLTIKDLNTIQNSFIKVFKGMYHERIAYPKEAIKSEDKSKTEETK